MHHHENSNNVVGKPAERALTHLNQSPNPDATSAPTNSYTWIWFPSEHELYSHYCHELGFIACLVQLLGMTVFCVAGVTALPPIYPVLDTTWELNGAFWIPQIIGGVSFVISGTLFLIETQDHWWQPAPSVLGWHIAASYLVGGIGFTLCPIFGMLTGVRWAAFQVACSTFWGSWAFLIGSVIQWYESLNKHPVEKEKVA